MRVAAKTILPGFQAGLRLALPFLPYRSPRILSSVQEVPQCLLEKHITNVLVVTDGFLHISGMLEPLKQALKSQGISYTVYDEVTPNPTILNVELARERYLQNGCQGLIGFGGGSSIDCAKAVGRPDCPAQQAHPQNAGDFAGSAAHSLPDCRAHHRRHRQRNHPGHGDYRRQERPQIPHQRFSSDSQGGGAGPGDDPAPCPST